MASVSSSALTLGGFCMARLFHNRHGRVNRVLSDGLAEYATLTRTCQAVTSMGRVHDVLRWANRRDVAREVTKRGYRLSGETLNRWVRDEQEFPAVVERIVFDLFTISGHEETPPPGWATALPAEIADEVVRRLGGLPGIVERAAAELGLDGPPPAAPRPEAGSTPPGERRTAPPRQPKRASR